MRWFSTTDLFRHTTTYTHYRVSKTKYYPNWSNFWLRSNITWIVSWPSKNSGQICAYLKTTAVIGAVKCNFSTFQGIMQDIPYTQRTDQQMDKPNKRRTDGELTVTLTIRDFVPWVPPCHLVHESLVLLLQGGQCPQVFSLACVIVDTCRHMYVYMENEHI